MPDYFAVPEIASRLALLDYYCKTLPHAGALGREIVGLAQAYCNEYRQPYRVGHVIRMLDKLISVCHLIQDGFHLSTYQWTLSTFPPIQPHSPPSDPPSS